MQCLIRGATLISAGTDHHERVADVHYADGRIVAIGTQLTRPEGEVELVEATGCCLMPAFLDIGTQVREPGLEQHEDLESVSAAARIGGYGALAPFPNTDPVVDGKTGVRFLQLAVQGLPVDFYPIGALTKGTAGEHPAELIDMYRQGAVAFSDGTAPLRDDGQLLRALQYAQSFDGTIIYQPRHGQLQTDGQMHEGRVSTSLGLRGMPAAAERTAVQRAIELLRYGGGRLHLYAISSAASLPLIAAAKAEGLALTASTTPLHLLLTDAALTAFDSAYKMMPPLRLTADRDALIGALADGTLDCIVSNHAPWDGEHKNLEFQYAAFGVPTLETAFSAAHTATQAQLSLSALSALFSSGPARVLNLPVARIAAGETLALTLYDPRSAWTVEASELRSKGYANPLTGRTLSGKIRRVFRKA